MRKLGFGLILVAGLAAAVAEAETYTVTVDAGSLEHPVSLDGQTVSRGSGGTLTMAEAAAAFAPGDVFCKKGAGFVAASSKLSGLSGNESEIRVEGGALVVQAAGQLGPTAVATAPKVIVSPGASLVYATTARAEFGNALEIAGAGVGNGGALNMRHTPNGGLSLSGSIGLSDDALIVDSAERYYLYASIHLHGKTLTFKGGDHCLDSVTIAPEAGGAFVADGCTFMMQGGFKCSGDASNTITFVNKAKLRYYNLNSYMPWTLVWKDGSYVYPDGNEAHPDWYYGPWGVTDRIYWQGPAVIPAGATLDVYGEAKDAGYTFRGALSGSGTLKAEGAWVHLINPENTFSGAISVSNRGTRKAGLGLYSPSALPLEGGKITVANAELRMTDNAVYNLRPVSFSVSDGGAGTIAGGLAGGTVAALAKKGAGTLDLEAPVAVTGVTELVEGTLRLKPVAGATMVHSAAPGLWFGSFSASKEQAGTYMGNEAPTCTNSVQASPHLFRVYDYPPWEHWMTATWTGYIWNRSKETVLWNLALTFGGYSYVWLDGEKITAVDDNGGLVNRRIRLTPGPHRITIKANPRSYGCAGGTNPRAADATNWKRDLGFALDRSGATLKGTDENGAPVTGPVPDGRNFRFAENGSAHALPGGDGVLFTRDERDIGDYTLVERAAFGRLASASILNLVASPGTVLDLGEGNVAPLGVDTLAGVTTVKNGDLVIRRRWKLSTADLANGAFLAVDGALAFGPDAVLDADLPLRLPASEVTIARVKDGTCPRLALSDELASKGFHLRVDGGDLKLHAPGLLLFVR